MKKSKKVSDFDKPQEWEVTISPTAFRQLKRLPSSIAQDIIDKIEWLCIDTENIKHSRLKGGSEFSLHSGQYRIIYTLDHLQRNIWILDIGKHDEAYRRLKEKQK